MAYNKNKKHKVEVESEYELQAEALREEIDKWTQLPRELIYVTTSYLYEVGIANPKWSLVKTLTQIDRIIQVHSVNGLLYVLTRTGNSGIDVYDEQYNFGLVHRYEAPTYNKIVTFTPIKSGILTVTEYGVLIEMTTRKTGALLPRNQYYNFQTLMIRSLAYDRFYDRIFAITHDGKVVAIDMSSCRKIYEVPLPGFSYANEIDCHDSRLFIRSHARIEIYNISDGSPVLTINLSAFAISKSTIWSLLRVIDTEGGPQFLFNFDRLEPRLFHFGNRLTSLPFTYPVKASRSFYTNNTLFIVPTAEEFRGCLQIYKQL